jgi:hypothetical protein
LASIEDSVTSSSSDRGAIRQRDSSWATLEAVEVHERHRQLPPAAPGVADGLGDALAEQDPVGQAGERIVPGLVLVELGLADQFLFGALALADVLDHGDGRRRATALVALQHGAHVGPQRVPRLGEAPRLQRKRLSPSAEHLGQELGHDLSVVAAQVVGEARAGELAGTDAEHLLERRVDLQGDAEPVEAEDADGGAVEQRAKARDGPGTRWPYRTPFRCP